MTEKREAWLEERRRGLGGSDIHHVLSEAPYGCARRLWFDKRNTPQDYADPETPLMQRGTMLEDLVADVYAEKSGRKVRRKKALVSKQHPFARVNLDRQIIGEKRGPGALEIKTHNAWVFKKVKAEGLQTAHVLQLQWALLVTGYTWGSFAILNPDSWQLIWFDVDRDDILIESLVRAADRFWRQVEHGPMPDPLPTIDRRCAGCPWRRQCRGEALIAAANFPKEDFGQVLPRDESLTELVADYVEAKRMADEADQTLELVKDAIRMRMGERGAAECERGRVYNAEQIAMRWDTRALDAEQSHLAEKYKKPVKSRPLRVYAI